MFERILQQMSDAIVVDLQFHLLIEIVNDLAMDPAEKRAFALLVVIAHASDLRRPDPRRIDLGANLEGGI